MRGEAGDVPDREMDRERGRGAKGEDEQGNGHGSCSTEEQREELGGLCGRGIGEGMRGGRCGRWSQWLGRIGLDGFAPGQILQQPHIRPGHGTTRVY
jgi:hypothetical protein